MAELDTEEHWRELAAQARSLAAGMADRAAEQTMLEIAARYDVLAERAKAHHAAQSTSRPRRGRDQRSDEGC